jgi:hypothetical protein
MLTNEKERKRPFCTGNFHELLFMVVVGYLGDDWSGSVPNSSMVQNPSSWIMDGYPGNIHPRGFGAIQG